jgi:Mg-chelatase subunit ChlD
MLRHIARAAALAVVAAPLFTASATAKQVVEVAFVLDTTGSMGPLIEGAKRKIWSIATSIVDCSPDAEIRMGLVAYRDIGDDYVTKRFDLTTDIQDLYGKLLALRAQGGGDWPESVNEALEVAVKRLSWTQDDNVKRIVFLVGDAPPHMDYTQDTKYPQVVRMARDRGIIVNAVQAGDAQDTARVWRTIAQMGNGEYIPIPQDGGQLVVIETPYDTRIIELQKKINGTVVPYGTRERRSDVEHKVGQVAAAPAPAASDMASYMNKRSAGSATSRAVTGDGDLVADAAEGRVKLDALKDEELPDNLKTMKPAERRGYVDKQITTRQALNSELSALVKQRDSYVATESAKQPAGAPDSFDRVVSTTIRKQVGK